MRRHEASLCLVAGAIHDFPLLLNSDVHILVEAFSLGHILSLEFRDSFNPDLPPLYLKATPNKCNYPASPRLLVWEANYELLSIHCQVPQHRPSVPALRARAPASGRSSFPVAR